MAHGDIDKIAEETGFSGVVWIDRAGQIEFAKAYGLANRTYHVPNSLDTRFGIASGSKGFTALAVLSLVHDGVLELSTTARSLLGKDLPLIADDVTVEHLLTHTSGIGDYLDEEADTEITDYFIGAAHELTTTEAFLPLLDGHPTKFRAGERFGYCNGGFVVLALLAERAGGVGYHDLVRERVLRPAGMTRTDFLRSDELPADAAVGYLPLNGSDRSNIFHLPVLATRRWRHPHHRRRHLHLLACAFRRRHSGFRRRGRTATLRRTQGIQALRSRLLAARDHRHGDLGRVRRRRVVQVHARPTHRHHLHRAFKHLPRRLAYRPRFHTLRTDTSYW
jgi:CubicO group peptidase (beta-lactamase class C family)